MRKKSGTKWKKLNGMKDHDIDFSDVPPLSPNFFRNAKLRLPQPKDLITIRLDHDILAWFKEQGKGYQTRINSILRMYMENQPRHRLIHRL